ncbi:hypothetical protein BJP37_20520 [Moorena bouillonii PNG]|uniref:Uncharacterized protein n=1 Tax=Moorena bouillonii PNG TaxID=568701 RepID=A0A1U7N509_9CYAN|nr:hypothetical protein BJP37_20520 [Moorena bouillonii PNG]
MRDLEQLTKDIQELPEDAQKIIADIMGASPKSCLTRWCVTGRPVQTLTTRRKMKAPLKHH